MNKATVLNNNQSHQVTFQNILQEELIKRCRKNPGYSLRAFAKSLRVEPSALSQMISGKRPISNKMKLRLGSALGLTVDELTSIPCCLAPYPLIEMDTFAFISDWYHYAILELTHVSGFNADPTWISRRLGITKAECSIAIQRLIRLNLLVETEDGSLLDISKDGKFTSLHPSMTSGAARNYQAQLLELSKNSVQADALEIRNHTSATFCFDTSEMPAAIESISRFRRQFAQEFQPQNRGDEVYQIQISFFPLTKNKETI